MAYQSMLPTEEVVFLTKRLNELFGQVLAENAELKEKNEKLYALGLNENTARFEDMKKIERLEDALKDEIKRNEELIKEIQALHKDLYDSKQKMMEYHLNGIESAIKETAKAALEQFIDKLIHLRIIGTKGDMYYELLEVKDDFLKVKYGIEVEE